MIEYLKAAQAMESLGMDSSELMQRARFRESVGLSIKQGDRGFRGGWVSTARIDSCLPPQYWAGILESMGYVLHPALKRVGRTQLLQGEGRTRLFIKKGNDLGRVATLRHAVRFYLSDQE